MLKIMGAGRGKPAAPASSDSQTENQPGIRKRLPCEIRMQKGLFLFFFYFIQNL